jgi:hypothetical protein
MMCCVHEHNMSPNESCVTSCVTASSSRCAAMNSETSYVTNNTKCTRKCFTKALAQVKYVSVCTNLYMYIFVV